MTSLNHILESFRSKSANERDKGTSFEKLIQFYLRYDPKYKDLFSDVWLYSDWAKQNGKDERDTGIDLVAKENDSAVIWAIQCKFYAEDAKIYKRHVDSFFTESGKAPFGHRLIVISTSQISEHVQKAMHSQQIPCSTLSLDDLSESSIDWTKYKSDSKPVYKEKKKLRPHQQKALDATLKGFETQDRGKLLMACGTGKTFTALKIAESYAGLGKQVLFLVPSLSLLSQTLNEWTGDTETPLHSFAVCSDVTTGKKKDEDLSDIMISDLAYPATTDAKKLAEKLSSLHLDKMTVVFSTYHSLPVISDAQNKFGLKDFDLVICDEAHRTTGATLLGDDESNFVKVHSQDYIKANKRLYMTATPRIFGDAIKSKAKEVEAVLCSMDDSSLYGEIFYTINFSDAVQLDLLSDYKVLVLAVDEGYISESIQSLLREGSELKLTDASKIVGCWKALSKQGVKEDVSDDLTNMKRAVAFCRDIKTSKLVKDNFTKVIDAYLQFEENKVDELLHCEVDHIDGTYKSLERKALLSWLKAADIQDENECRILSNARCLSEGVDVPSLDAILFLNPRKSQIDIVQSVGRVMRKSPGKKRGYIILPIGIPAGITPEKALEDNERFQVVWQVLQALRSHDDRFDAMINKIDLGVDMSSKMEIVAISHALPNKRTKDEDDEIGIGKDGKPKEDPKPSATQVALKFGELEKSIYAKLVKKCGNRRHWEEWAGDIAKIAQTHITRITSTLNGDDKKSRVAFDEFLDEIRDDLNPSISKEEAIEMLAQHIITKPIFDALFSKYDFTQQNPVSLAIQKVLDVLNETNLEVESESLRQFYQSVRFRAEGIETAEGRQKIILELYDKFFKNAFPRLTEKLGIVYTPVEVVDFIIHSVNDVLQSEFRETLGSRGVHILDPFTGTGTFITRLMQSGLISKEELIYKYQNEIHANEIVLLAYYIAAINIESVYHSITGNDYKPFQGICLTDTFQLYEKDDLISSLMVDNSSRRVKQKALDIKVIMGNPPYSAGQTSANDNNANVSYPHLDESIRQTYAKNTSVTNKNSLYDSYIRAIRWGSDRIGNSGVMAYVSNAGWIDGNAMDGLRKCLVQEFSSIYVFHLRGNARTSGELRRKEKDNVFGQGTRTPIAISVLVKNPDSKEHGKIYFHDIGDYLNREEKLKIISDFKSINGISNRNSWQQLTPDKHNDWLAQRDDSFEKYISLGDKKNKAEKTIFENYSSGLKTNRDAWCYNYSNRDLSLNIKSMIDFYNLEVENIAAINIQKPNKIEDVITFNPQKIKWTNELIDNLSRAKVAVFENNKIVKSTYRPFSRSWVYFDRFFNSGTYQMFKIFPEMSCQNISIVVSGMGSNRFSVFISNSLPCLDMVEKGQCFPLKLYEKVEDKREPSLFDNPSDDQNIENGYRVKDGITDAGLKHFQSAYPEQSITKEDIFYYIYGLLHSKTYRDKYADNLSKQLPRIPCVKKAEDFWKFSKAGRELADLHLNYEKIKPYPVKYKDSLDITKLEDKDFRVEKMKFGKDKDKSIVTYNHKITMLDIPIEAYDYVVNGKPALEWVMERQCVKTDKDSGIVNDANLYATETVKDAKYPLLLFQRVIRVSLDTMKIVNSLPPLDL